MLRWLEVKKDKSEVIRYQLHRVGSGNWVQEVEYDWRKLFFCHRASCWKTLRQNSSCVRREGRPSPRWLPNKNLWYLHNTSNTDDATEVIFKHWSDYFQTDCRVVQYVGIQPEKCTFRYKQELQPACCVLLTCAMFHSQSVKWVGACGRVPRSSGRWSCEGSRHNDDANKSPQRHCPFRAA